MNFAFAGYKHGHTGAMYHEAAEHPDINILGAWEDSDAGRQLAAGTGISFNYPTFADLISDQHVDVVCLGGSYGERGSEAIAALKAGKHVYADKPLCITLEELDEIEALASAKNLKVGCYLTMRYSAGIRTLYETIRSGQLGEIGSVNVTAQHPLSYGSRPDWYYKEGQHGGTINDIGIHAVDLVRFVTGLGVKNVTAARTWNHFATEEPHFHDCGQFMAELENGAGMIADVSYAAPNGCGGKLETYWRVTFWGTKGVAEYKLNGKRTPANTVLQIAYNNDAGFAAVDDAQSFPVKAIDEFVREINGNTETILTTADVIRTSRDILRIQAAANNSFQ